MNQSAQALVLASTSVYRRVLLQKLHVEFTCCAVQVDETALPGETGPALALRLSIAKAQAAAANRRGLIIGSDQVAVCNGVLLGKPGTAEVAEEQLARQSGQVVAFYTAVCVLDTAANRQLTDLDSCYVHFKPLSAEQIRRYLAVEQPFDCAGSFKSEGYGISLFERINGDDPNALVGLPLIKLCALLNQCGLLIP